MKWLKIAAVAVAAAMLGGCSAMSFSVDSLLGAPKLSEEQEAIHKALTSAVGSSVTLKYPKNGANRSAFVIANVDSEQGEEALVFYEYNTGSGTDDGIRLNLLDKNEDGDWYSVKELAGSGTEVDRVIISRMGEKNEIFILVGYQSITSSDCTLEIYSYREGELRRVGSDTYSVLETLDINSDGYNELITIDRAVNQETGAITAKASMLGLRDGEIVKEDSIEMLSGVTGYSSTVTGLLNPEHGAIFLDGVNADGALQTEIVYYRYSSLQDPMQQSPEKLLPLCTRPAGYYSGDVDGDGIVEIPSVRPMTGYENAVADEIVYMTSWNVYEDFFNLTEKYRGYYSRSDGWFMAFPKRWTELVTVKRDNSTGELVFYKFDGDINSSKMEIMRIAVASRNVSQAYEDDGYLLIDSKGQLDYYVKLPEDKREPLILTIDEVRNNFYITD
ncbi:MAG: hypothetical protein IJ737_05010 [Ruminococcus sp.]|nr:hypothetical protein [Ruminococcus sp.]